MKRVLVTWGSRLGGTEGIARIVGEVLASEGLEVTVLPARQARDPERFDAVIVGGALYANRWHRDAHRFVCRNVAALRARPVWLFSSGPLDDSADREEIPPPPRVAVLGERIGAQGHVTFGGRLAPDAKGFIAASMAKKTSGDWRNPDRIRRWAAGVAQAIPAARPRAAIDPPARSPMRLAVHGIAGWAICTGLMGVLLAVASAGVAFALRAVAVPIVFTVVAVKYFREPGARDPLPAALGLTALCAAFEAAVVAPFLLAGYESFASVTATWLPFLLVFLSTWLTGLLMSTRPWPRASTGRP